MSNKIKILAMIALLLLVGGALACFKLSTAQEDADGGATLANLSDAAALDKTQSELRLVARLLLVRADWSQHELAAEIESQLKELLEGVQLPEGFRPDVLTVAPRIMFPDGLLALYRPEDIRSLVSWLVARDLVRIVGPPAAFERPEPQPGAFFFDRSIALNTDGTAWSSREISSLTAELDLIPIGISAPPVEQPFVERAVRWQWSFTSTLRTAPAAQLPIIEIDGSRTLKMYDELQRSRTPVREQPLSGTDSYHCELPSDHVAALHFLYGLTASRRAHARAHGWEAVVLIGPESAIGDPLAAADPNRAKLAMPASVVEVSQRGSSRSTTAPIEDSVDESVAAVDEVRIFNLAHMPATTAADLLTPLYASQGLTLVADQRLQAVLVRGPSEKIVEVEALLLRLDTPAAESPLDPFADSAAAGVPDQVSLQEARSAYATAQRQISSLIETSPAGETVEAQGLRGRLRPLVEQSFDLRQQLQQVEARTLRIRIDQIQQQIRRRAAMRDEIVARHVDQLLSGPIAAASGEPADPTSSSGAVVPGSMGLQPAAAAPAPSITTLRSPEEFQKAVRDAQISLDVARGSLGQLDLAPGVDATAGSSERYLAAARQRLNLIRAEYQAQVRLLELEAASTQAAAQAAQEDYEEARRLHQRGYTSQSTFERAKLQVEQARLRAQQIEVLLALYRQAKADVLGDESSPGDPAAAPSR